MTGSKVEQLHAIMREYPLAGKVLIAPSYATGHQWLEQLCRRHGVVLHVEVATLESWALGRMKLALARQGLRYAGPSETGWIVCALLERLSREPAGRYLAGLPLTPGLTGAIHDALLELRECGLDAERLEPKLFEQPEKGVFMKELLLRYERWLRDEKRLDWGGLAREAALMPASGRDVVVIADAAAIRSAADMALLARLSVPAGGYRLLKEDPALADEAAFAGTEVDFFHAAGALAEVREVRRRIAAQGLPFDEVEIVASDPALYASAIQTVMAPDGVVCTFADGLPPDASRIGRAAKLYLDWISSDFRLEPMLAVLKQSLIRLHDDEAPDISPGLLLRELQCSGIGWGKARYALLGKLSEQAGVAGERAAALRRLHRLFDELLAPLDDETIADPVRLVQQLASFLESHGVLAAAGDYETLQGIQSLQQAMSGAGSLRLSRELSLRYVREALERIRIGAEPLPLPGRIHVAPLASGGASGRPHTFIVGMSERHWTVAPRQNPVLLDEERQRIHPLLPTGAETAKRRLQERSGRLGMLRGRCTMSYCSYDPAEQKEEMPAYELLRAFRRQAGREDADYGQLHAAMGKAIPYCQAAGGDGSALAADETELWMGAVQRPDGSLRRASRLLHAAYPRLRQGAAAEEARRAHAAVTAYDGIVDTALHPVPLPGGRDGASAFSASMLERYGRCPLQYFFHNQLGVRPDETVPYDRARWLDASQRGSLLHGIFERYLAAIRVTARTVPEVEGADAEAWGSEAKTGRADAGAEGGEGAAAVGDGAPSGDRALLDAIADELIREYAERVPAPSDHIYRKEADSIRRDVAVFFAEESKRGTRPVLTELQLHGEEAPLHVRLAGGRSLPVRGFVDRVDEIAPHRYKIYDYKTGNPVKYSENECFAGGTLLQLPLYGLAAEQWMRESGFDREAVVAETAYLFPTERGMGAEVSRPQNRREELASLLDAMLAGMRQGLFPPAADPKDCTWCDYREVCGNHAQHFAAKRGDERNAGRLGPILEVGGYV